MHQQLPGWRSLIKSIVGRVYANSVKSKQASPWIVASMDALQDQYYYVIPDVLVETPLHCHFLWAPFIVHHIGDFRLFCMFLTTCCCTQFVCKRRSFISPCMDWQTYLWGGGIISAVAEGCREVVWHRHWLSLLRSEGIARLRKKRKERSEVNEQMNKTANWIGWDASVLWVSFIYLFHFFRNAFCSGWTNNQSCFSNSRLSGGGSISQIAKRR